MDCQAQALRIEDEDAFEITVAALHAYGRLLRAVGRTVTTHAASDGGLICEDRTRPSRPTVWRIAADGTVLPDSQYDFVQRSFIAGRLPSALHGQGAPSVTAGPAGALELAVV